MAKANKAKISIIVTCYKGGATLPVCLGALLKQSLKEIEVICVNDGSPDNTKEIIEDYARRDSRIKVINNAKNSGVAKSRNKGIDIAESDFIMFCDADDYYEPTMCEEMLGAIEESKADIAISEIKVSYEAHRELKYSDDNYYSLKFSGLEEIRDDIILMTDLSPTNKIFRKSIIEKNNIRFPEGLYFEDAYFCSAYLCCSKDIYYLNEKLYNYIRHEKSTMSNTFSSKTDKDPAIDHLYVAIKLFEFLKERELLEKYNNVFWKLFYSFELFALNNSKTRPRINEVKDETLAFINENRADFNKAELYVRENILAANTKGLKINKVKIKKALIRLMPTYRLQVSNVQRLRALKHNTCQLLEKISTLS